MHHVRSRAARSAPGNAEAKSAARAARRRFETCASWDINPLYYAASSQVSLAGTIAGLADFVAGETSVIARFIVPITTSG